MILESGKIIAQSRSMRSVMEQVKNLQKTCKTNVLIRGETGTGKELIARAIHENSSKKNGPFIPVNCASIPEQLTESSLFGHVQGAFTGASTRRKGYFELAHNGTLFFDEIGDMPPAQQVKLLRVIEDNRFMSVGAHRETSTNVRIVAATNAHLEDMIETGLFRRDLYYRISAFSIYLPPLRERDIDIPLLAGYFVDTLSKQMNLPHRPISSQAMQLLQTSVFQGNVRELKNIVEHALILCDGPEILPEHLPPTPGSLPQVSQPPNLPPTQGAHTTFGGHAPPFQHTSLPQDQMEFLLIQGALAQAGHDISIAAELLNVSPLYIKTACQRIAPKPPAPPTDEEKIIQHICLNESINNSECRTLLDTDIHRASYLLKKLYKNGTLVRRKGGRWTRYFLPDASGN